MHIMHIWIFLYFDNSYILFNTKSCTYFKYQSVELIDVKWNRIDIQRLDVIKKKKKTFKIKNTFLVTKETNMHKTIVSA